MPFFHVISTDGKSMQPQRKSFNVFLEDKNRGCFDVSFWYVFDILKRKVIWTSLFDIILFSV